MSIIEKIPSKMITEPPREVKVCRETDVIVVGGGPAGVAAAVASARNGAHTVLVERYGHLGGMATGGLVILIMPMSDAVGQQQIAGLCQEMVDRLDERGSAVHPAKGELGSSNRERVGYWLSRGCRFFAMEERVTLNVLFDPEMFKCVLNDMAEEAGVKLFLHSWGSRALVDGNQVRGIVFESKSGRLAIMGRVVVDATGDGDMFASAGAEFDATMDPSIRSAMLALVFRVGNIDFTRLGSFQQSRPDEYDELIREVERLGGFSRFIRTWKEDVVWFNNNLPGLDGLNVEDLTWVEVSGRKKMLITYEFFRKNVPGFEDAYVMDTASQVGVRCTRRLLGEHTITEQDIQAGRLYEDTIAVIPARQWAPTIRSALVHIPYRSLLPRKVENLLVAGRCLSSDQFANNILSPIQCCVAMGEAAGTGAALAVKNSVPPKLVGHGVLRERLIAQGVPLPGT
jgi:hypothetical protein